jgi:hypothetical protein
MEDAVGIGEGGRRAWMECRSERVTRRVSSVEGCAALDWVDGVFSGPRLSLPRFSRGRKSSGGRRYLSLSLVYEV